MSTSVQMQSPQALHSTDNFALIVPPQGSEQIFKSALFTIQELKNLKIQYAIYVGDSGRTNPPPALPGATCIVQGIWLYIVKGNVHHKPAQDINAQITKV